MDTEDEPNQPVKILTEIRAILAMWVLRALYKDLEPAFDSEPSIRFEKCPKTGNIEYLLCDSLESLVFAFSKIQKLLIEKSMSYDPVTTDGTEGSEETSFPDSVQDGAEIQPPNPQTQSIVVGNIPEKTLLIIEDPDNEQHNSSNNLFCIDTGASTSNADLTDVVSNENCQETNISQLDNTVIYTENLDGKFLSNNTWTLDVQETQESNTEATNRDKALVIGHDAQQREEDCEENENEESTDISSLVVMAPGSGNGEENRNIKAAQEPVTTAPEGAANVDSNRLCLRRSGRRRLANKRYTFPSNFMFEDRDSEKEDEKTAETGDAFSSKKNYEEAMPYKYFCEQCSFKTKRISHLKKHKAIHKKVTTLYRCGQCLFTSMRLGHLRRHESTHSTVLHKCDRCSYTTDDIKLLVRHAKQKHQSYKESLDGRVLTCKECTYKTQRQHLFDRHKRIHCVRNHQCSLCPYRTWRKEHYNRHVNNVHKNKRPYLCHLCGKAFKRGDSLRHHQTIFHTADASTTCSFACQVCAKTFRTQSHLDEHRAVHSNIRSFLCEICGSSFKTRSVQRKHIQTIHQNPRSKSCAHCDKKFNTIFALRRHLKVHNYKGDAPASSTDNNEMCIPEPATNVPDNAVLNGTDIVLTNRDKKADVEPKETSNGISVFTLAPTLQTDNDLIQETVLATELIGTLHPPTVLQSTEVTSALLFLTSTTII